MFNVPHRRVRIDRPTPLAAAGGGMDLCGWCFDESSSTPTSARLVVGERIYPCESGLPRPDVAAAFPKFPQAARSGFILRRWMPPGYATAHVEISGDGNDWVRVKSLPFCSEFAPLIVHIDRPTAESSEEGLVIVSGWALHPQEEIEELRVAFRDQSAICRLRLLPTELPRGFEGVPGSHRVAFEARLQLRAATAHLRVTARLKNGATVIYSPPTPFTVRRAADAEALLRMSDLQRCKLLRLAPAIAPRVSIIIAVHNHIDVTLACLDCVLRHTRGVSHEIILVDDCSDEHTAECLRRIDGLHLIRNETNLGFLRSCNKAATAAKGEYLLFLNNDTEATAGWLGALLRVFEQRPDAGLVGSKLIFPDGRLQEAGGIMWRDASGVNYGKWDDPEKPEYNYLRRVDYCSGACILVPRGLFRELGGFDERYTPAYYEDTDLAFSIRAAGRSVYYQPRSVVIHHEGISSGTSTAAGVKAYQLVNQEKFRSKWQNALAQHLRSDVGNVWLAKDHNARKRALVVDARVLAPDQDSGSVRMLNLLGILQELGYLVTFVPGNLQHVSPYTERMQDLGIECLHDPYFPSVEYFFEMRGPGFDLVILSRAEVAHTVLPYCRKYIPEVPVIFDTVDLHFLREQREAEFERDPTKRFKAEERQAMELKLIQQCDAAVVVSPIEKELLESKLPAQHVAIVSNIHEIRTEPIAPFEGRRDFLFIGGFEHTPNVDAMIWFSAAIMPLVLRDMPEAKLHIIGSKMPDTVRALATTNILAHGYVEDVAPFFASCLLSVAPLRWGAGVKGKINQSMSYGVPVVSTAIGAEGMYLVEEESILIADAPADFAAQILRLSRDQALWKKLSDNGRRNIAEHFSVDAARRALTTLLAELRIA